MDILINLVLFIAQFSLTSIFCITLFCEVSDLFPDDIVSVSLRLFVMTISLLSAFSISNVFSVVNYFHVITYLIMLILSIGYVVNYLRDRWEDFSVRESLI